MFAELMEEYFKLINLNYKQQDYYRSLAYDWLFEGCFARLYVMIRSMYDWMEKFYNISSSIKFSDKEMERINSTLQEFNKAVIMEIEKYKEKMEIKKNIKITFNKAAMEWIDKKYKEFKKKWFSENCDINCEKVFRINNKI